MANFSFTIVTARSLIKHQLKEQLDLNAATRSLILTILASFYIPLAFVSSYFGMNARGFTEGGLVSTSTFWQVSAPLVVASIIIPVAFSGLLIHIFTKVVYSIYRQLERLCYFIFIMGVTLSNPGLGSWLLIYGIRNKFTRTRTGMTDTSTNAA